MAPGEGTRTSNLSYFSLSDFPPSILFPFPQGKGLGVRLPRIAHNPQRPRSVNVAAKSCHWCRGMRRGDGLCLFALSPAVQYLRMRLVEPAET